MDMGTSTAMAGMDMATSTAMAGMDMASSTMTAMASATSAAMDMDSMSMGGDCKISMLWNWYTVDACFISSTWQVTSKGMFAGSCIGVVALVCSLEFLRRLGREYDRYVSQAATRRTTRTTQVSHADMERSHQGPGADKLTADVAESSSHSSGSSNPKAGRGIVAGIRSSGLAKPTITQQLLRSLIHMLQFGVAYFVMLLAMYYNGYIIICILIGAFLGSFIFGWDLAAKPEPSGCCG